MSDLLCIVAKGVAVLLVSTIFYQLENLIQFQRSHIHIGELYNNVVTVVEFHSEVGKIQKNIK